MIRKVSCRIVQSVKALVVIVSMWPVSYPSVLADICLVPQVFNAQRFDCDLSSYPTIERIFTTCMGLEAFDAAQPSKQPEAISIS